MTDKNPLAPEVFERLMAPRDWGKSVLAATRKGWPLPMSAKELALRLQGTVSASEEADRIAADLAINRLKNSGDLHRREALRALQDQIQNEHMTP